MLSFRVSTIQTVINPNGIQKANLCACCGSHLPVFGVRVSVTFHFMCVHITFSSVWVAEWSPFGK